MKQLLLILFLVIGTSSFAQTVSFDETGKKFKTAVAKNDIAAIADMMEFPFSSFDWGFYVAEQNSSIETREDFLKASKKIFTKKVTQQIAKSEFKKVEDESDGSVYYTLIFYSGEKSSAWIIFNLVNDQWKAIGTNNISWGD